MLTIKIQSKNYEKDLVLTVVYPKNNTSSSELSKFFGYYFEKMALIFSSKQMRLMRGDLNIDPSETNSNFLTLKNALGRYDLNNMSLRRFNSETINSQTKIDVVYCSQEV